MYINWFTCIIFFMILYVIQKSRSNKNSITITTKKTE